MANPAHCFQVYILQSCDIYPPFKLWSFIEVQGSKFNKSCKLHWDIRVRQVLLCYLPLRAVGTLIGEGVSNFVTDWDKVSATVSQRRGRPTSLISSHVI